jgi:parallel beta-helix repeat protein
MKSLTCFAMARRITVPKTLAPALLAGMALLLAGQEVRSDENLWIKAISGCGMVISRPGHYFLANDLTECPGAGISITVSSVSLDLRGHIIQVTGGTGASAIEALGGDGALKNLEIAGPGTLTGGLTGINFGNVHDSRVHDVTMVQNSFGMAVNSGDFTSDTTAAATVSANNEFVDNVITANNGHGITVNGGSKNLFFRNNVSGNNNGGVGLLLFAGQDNFAHDNTADANSGWGIYIAAQSSGNKVEHNTAVGNSNADLNDQNGDCTHNTWTGNSFVSNSPGCIH